MHVVRFACTDHGQMEVAFIHWDDVLVNLLERVMTAIDLDPVVLHTGLNHLQSVLGLCITGCWQRHFGKWLDKLQLMGDHVISLCGWFLSGCRARFNQ